MGWGAAANDLRSRRRVPEQHLQHALLVIHTDVNGHHWLAAAPALGTIAVAVPPAAQARLQHGTRGPYGPGPLRRLHAPRIATSSRSRRTATGTSPRVLLPSLALDGVAPLRGRAPTAVELNAHIRHCERPRASDPHAQGGARPPLSPASAIRRPSPALAPPAAGLPRAGAARARRRACRAARPAGRTGRRAAARRPAPGRGRRSSRPGGRGRRR